MKGVAYMDILFEEILEKYKSTVFGIALSRTGNRADAEDIFQEVFLTYHKKQPVFNSSEHIKAWLIRVTVNHCRKSLRTRLGRGELPDNLQTDDFCFAYEEENAVFTALRTLPEKYRNVLHLFYFESMRVDEISRALKINPNTVKVQLKRGRELMREKLEKDYFYN